MRKLSKTIGLLGVMLVVSGVGHTRELAIQSNTAEQWIVADESPSSTTRLEVYDLPKSGGATARGYVKFRDGGSTLIADIEATGDAVSISGSVDRTTFSFERSRDQEGRIRIGLAFGQASVAVVVGPDGLSEADRLALENYLRDLPENAFTVAGKLRDVQLSTQDLDLRNPKLFNLASAAARGTGGVRDTPIVNGGIQELRDCMREACTDSGGCVDVSQWWECRTCPGSSWWQNRVSGFLYLMQAEICFAQWVNPLF